MNGPTGFLDRYVIEEHLAAVPSPYALRSVMVLRVAENRHSRVPAFSLFGWTMHGYPTGSGGMTIGSVQSLGGQVVAVLLVP